MAPANVDRYGIFHFRSIGAIRKHLTDSSTTKLVHSLITTQLDYCNSLLYGLSDSKIQRLQKIQNIAARILTRSPKTCHITPVLKDLHWLPIKSRILFKLLLFMFKAYHQTTPTYITNLITPYNPIRSLRSSEQLLLEVPRTRLNSFGSRAFSVAGPREWNKLPIALRKVKTLNSFKTSLKTFLFKQF